ncbi:hypothetical protein PIB30_050369 [Stylosanthes scabra]|uniref:Uncharacterized protein n=1 Tax=Stylosanthes scabra TaxID=79078 RepID=A0ABU6QGY6_9FABA|nr:hypothetical protein [Stylosanthes scabra]
MQRIHFNNCGNPIIIVVAPCWNISTTTTMENATVVKSRRTVVICSVVPVLIRGIISNVDRCPGEITIFELNLMLKFDILIAQIRSLFINNLLILLIRLSSSSSLQQ